MKINFYEFFKTREFLFFRKMETNIYRGYILVRQKMGETPIEIIEDFCLPYSDFTIVQRSEDLKDFL